MEKLEEISRQYEQTKRELLHWIGAQKNNGASKASRGKKHYLEKTVLHSLHEVINSYCSLVIVHREGRHSHGTNKGKGGPQNGDRRRNVKDSCKNRWSDGAAHDELSRRVAQKKAIQHRHVARVNRFVKTDKAIGTFGKYVERVFRLRRHSTCDGETEQGDASSVQEIHPEEKSPNEEYKRLPKRRIQIILERDIHFDLFLGAVLNFLQMLLRTELHRVNAEANCVKDNPPCVSNLTNEGKKNWWSRMLSEGGRGKQLGVQTTHVKRLPAQKERVTHFVDNPHGPSSSSRDTAHRGEERKRRSKNDSFKDPPSGVNSPLYPMDMKMLLWSSLLDGNHHPYNFIIRKVDPNLLYIIDSDRTLLRILFFFNVVHLFVTYMYVTICQNELLFSCLSVFVTIIRGFHGTFKLVSNGATEWKHAYPFFCAFASMVKRDILPSGGGSQEEECIPEGNTLQGMHNQGGENSHVVHSFGGLCFGVGRGDARKDVPRECLNSQTQKKGKKKNEQIGASPHDQYCYYATVKNEDEVDSVNLAIHVTNTSKDNISFYRRYIEEHIQRVFLHVYKLSEPKKRICSSEKNKEEGINDPSIFKNYRQLFRSFFQEIVS
ncbi:Uncharacterized protein PCOAH_00016190 [Plasmodium coatneyi]|uniref:Uncharacterized protein n=1 Tax=Plasmodium coatneyi TaxID=208452 RepID=A0A1B1DXA3_9APIC|nr:Uncharacterized protein PCOAH_00016190 [Plasmodium coatneyi]ANQ07259.1 Uncharacterized protein PCOAH_00016190 [Plasmodium coatneyi]